MIEFGSKKAYLQFFHMETSVIEDYVILDPEEFITPNYILTDSVRNAFITFYPFTADEPLVMSNQKLPNAAPFKMAKLAIKTQNKMTSTFCNDPLDIKCHVVLIKSFSNHQLISYRYIMPNGYSYSRDLPSSETGFTKCHLREISKGIGF